MSERIILQLPERIVQVAKELADQSERTIEAVLVEWIERGADATAEDDDDAEWDAMVVTRALGDALNEDGSIDFDKLRARTVPMSLEELYPEGISDEL
jgi:hypothetical protein